jgi:hypothetical protein
VKGELADKTHPYWTAPRDMWLLVRSPTSKPYPCRCTPGCGARCPCRGRVDVEGMPTACCARRAAETAARKNTEEGA